MISVLFSPLGLGSIVLQNRIVVSPMCQYSATDGSAGAWHRTHWGTLAGSGAALLMIEATAVNPEGRITWGDLGLYSDANERALGHQLEGALAFSQMPIGIQLGHAGRKASSEKPWLGGQQLLPDHPHGWSTVAPTATPVAAGELAPTALTRAEMSRIRDDFVSSARRAARLPLAALQLHFAHGYLIHQFLSPITNRRDDEYGGPIENRVRFALEVFDAVRQSWPDKPLGIRVSATDWIEGGWDLAQTLELACRAQQLGCDWIDVSTGGLAPEQKIPVRPGYQQPFGRELRRATGMLVSTVGLITDPHQAEEIVVSGDADLVSLGRALLWNPHWPWQAAAQLGASVAAPSQYWRSAPHGVRGVFSSSRDGSRASPVVK